MLDTDPAVRVLDTDEIDTYLEGWARAAWRFAGRGLRGCRHVDPREEHAFAVWDFCLVGGGCWIGCETCWTEIVAFEYIVAPEVAATWTPTCSSCGGDEVAKSWVELVGGQALVIAWLCTFCASDAGGRQGEWAEDAGAGAGAGGEG